MTEVVLDQPQVVLPVGQHETAGVPLCGVNQVADHNMPACFFSPVPLSAPRRHPVCPPITQRLLDPFPVGECQVRADGALGFNDRAHALLVGNEQQDPHAALAHAQGPRRGLVSVPRRPAMR